jgi:hypothetical protein
MRDYFDRATFSDKPRLPICCDRCRITIGWATYDDSTAWPSIICNLCLADEANLCTIFGIYATHLYANPIASESHNNEMRARIEASSRLLAMLNHIEILLKTG